MGSPLGSRRPAWTQAEALISNGAAAGCAGRALGAPVGRALSSFRTSAFRIGTPPSHKHNPIEAHVRLAIYPRGATALRSTRNNGLQLSPGARHLPLIARHSTSRRALRSMIVGLPGSVPGARRVDDRSDARPAGRSRRRSGSNSQEFAAVPLRASHARRARGCSPITTHGHALRTILGRLRASEVASLFQPGV